MKELYSGLSDRLMSLAATAQVDGKIDGADLLHALTAASAMFQEAADVIENQDKYRWHDLREKPNDLTAFSGCPENARTYSGGKEKCSLQTKWIQP